VAVVACDDGSVHRLQVHTGRLDGRLTIASRINAIAVTDDGVGIASCTDGGLRRLDMVTGAITLIGHALGTTSSVAVTPDGSSAVTGGNDGSVVRWNLGAGASDSSSIVLNVGTAVRALALASGADRVLIAGKDGTIRLHSLPSGDVVRDLTGLLRAAAASSVSASAAPASAAPAHVSPVVDNDVQFTVYRPSVLSAGRWQLLLVFAHKSEPVVDPDDGLIRPLDEVKARARAQFGDVETHTHSVDAQQALLRGNALHIVPDLPGLSCDPATATVLWREPVHEARFLIRASTRLAGSVVRGWVRVWCGPLILGEVSVRLRVAPVGAAPPAFEDDHLTGQRLSRYRKIFPSYSRRDGAVVEQVAVAARAIGDQYLQDVLTLRSGEPWPSRLLELIEEADVFQLFWSSNSMRSPHCRTEWEHALALRRPTFVRPLYWEDPFPEAPDLGMPPAQLRSLHFAHLPVTVPSSVPAPRQRGAKPSAPPAWPSEPPARPSARPASASEPPASASEPPASASEPPASASERPARASDRHATPYAPSARPSAPPARPYGPPAKPLSPTARKRSRAAVVVAVAVLILAVALCAALVVSRGGSP
jgi:hypothetical protein